MSESVRRYSAWIRMLVVLLGLGALWSTVNVTGDIISGFAKARGLLGTYVLLAASSVWVAFLFLFVGLRGRVPLWMARANDPTQAR